MSGQSDLNYGRVMKWRL